MAVDLSKLLGKKGSEIEKPKPLPVGNYGWMILGHEIVESSQKKTPGVEFSIQPFEAKDDVDEDLLAEVKEPFKRKMRVTYWVTEDALWRLSEFLQKLGVADENLEEESRSLEEMIPETTGQQFIMAVRQETKDDGNVLSLPNENTIQPYE